MVDLSPTDRARKYGLCWSCTMPRADRHHDPAYRMARTPYDIPGHAFVDPPVPDVGWPDDLVDHPLAPGDAALLVYPAGDADVVLVLDDLDVGGTATVKLPNGKITIVDRDSVSYFGPGSDFRPLDRVADAQDYADALGDPDQYR